MLASNPEIPSLAIGAMALTSGVLHPIPHPPGTAWHFREMTTPKHKSEVAEQGREREEKTGGKGEKIKILGHNF